MWMFTISSAVTKQRNYYAAPVRRTRDDMTNRLGVGGVSAYY